MPQYVQHNLYPYAYVYLGVRADLAVMDIMRGRDFGIPTYTAARASLGLSVPTTFAGITNDASVAGALQTLYGSVDRVELWVGGLAESASSPNLIGSTFRAIISAQFQRTRNGDYYHFENTAAGSTNGECYFRHALLHCYYCHCSLPSIVTLYVGPC